MIAARTKALALDTGTSSEAAAHLNARDGEHVRAAITVILSECGPLTDDQIVERYLERCGAHPSLPRVTPQRIRTARAELVRLSQVRDANLLAFSSLGNRATAWTIA